MIVRFKLQLRLWDPDGVSPCVYNLILHLLQFHSYSKIPLFETYVCNVRFVCKKISYSIYWIVAFTKAYLLFRITRNHFLRWPLLMKVKLNFHGYSGYEYYFVHLKFNWKVTGSQNWTLLHKRIQSVPGNENDIVRTKCFSNIYGGFLEYLKCSRKSVAPG